MATTDFIVVGVDVVRGFGPAEDDVFRAEDASEKFVIVVIRTRLIGVGGIDYAAADGDAF